MELSLLLFTTVAVLWRGGLPNSLRLFLSLDSKDLLRDEEDEEEVEEGDEER